MSYQFEFEFVGDPSLSKQIRRINPIDVEFTDDELDLPKFYRTNKFFDWLFDKLPYSLGWKWYHKYHDVRQFVISSYQKIRYGVSDEECWNLSYTIARYTLPRLKHFKKMKRCGIPSNYTEKEWEDVIDEVIWVMDYILDDEKYNPFPIFDTPKSMEDFETSFNREKTPKEKEDLKKYLDKCRELNDRKEKALILFAKNFEHFWD